MSPATAIDSPVFRAYVVIVAGVLVAAGVILGALRLAGKDTDSMLATYKGWLVMAPLVIGVIFLGRAATIVGVTLLALFGFREFARATGLYRDWWQSGVVYAAIAALGGIAFATDPRLDIPGWYGLYMAFPVYVVGALMLVPILRNRAKGELQAVSLSILGFVYFGWMFLHLAWFANTPYAYGYLLYIVFAVELNDVAAFTCGKLFGHRKLRSEISPNKTVGGAVGAVVVSLAAAFALSFSFPHFPAWQVLLAGLIVGIGGQLGDLAISYIKRDIGIKDMGRLIRGHGGILDRIDSMIFVAPLFFHMTRWFHGS